MVQKQNVEFAAEDNVTLRGWLFVPDGPGPHPAITMAHGYAGVKEHGLERFAQAFADAGFVVLLHDHRGFGASDGSPRHDVDPWRQIADWRRAISYPGEPARRRPRPDRPVGHQLRRRPRDRAGRHRPAAARGRRPGAHHQRISSRACGASRPTRSRPSEAAFADDERAAVPRRAAAPPRPSSAPTPPVPAAYRAPDAIDFYLQPVPDGAWDNDVTRALHARGAHVRAGHLDRPRLAHAAAHGRRPARHHHPHRPGARRPTSARCSPRSWSPSPAVTSTPTWRASPKPAAPRSPGSPNTSTHP